MPQVNGISQRLAYKHSSMSSQVEHVYWISQRQAYKYPGIYCLLQQFSRISQKTDTMESSELISDLTGRLRFKPNRIVYHSEIYVISNLCFGWTVTHRGVQTDWRFNK